MQLLHGNNSNNDFEGFEITEDGKKWSWQKGDKGVEDTWMIKHSDNLKTKFSGQPGVRTALNDNAKAEDFFPWFFGEELPVIYLIVKETNHMLATTTLLHLCLEQAGDTQLLELWI